MSKEYIGKTCPYCKTPLVEGDTVVFCSVCDMPHHLSCWQDNQGCTTFGCTGSIKEIIGNDSGTAAAPAAPQPAPAPVVAPKPVQATPTKPAPAPAQVEQTEKPIETLYESKEMVFMSDVPLVLENAAIIIDRTKDKLFARCTFRSITDKAIKAVLIEVSCQDVWGDTVGDPIAFQYIDLKTKRESKFGQTNPIDLPDKTTRKIQVAVKKVLFAGDSVISCSGTTFTMAAPVLLSKHLSSDALAAEYARETSPKAQFVLETSNDYWRCACGTLNTGAEGRCYTCGCTREQLTAALNPDALNANMRSFAEAKRAAAERAQAEQAERIRLAEEQVRLEQERKELQFKMVENLERKKKRRKKTVTAIIVSLVVVALLGCGVVFFGIPYFNYQAACDALDNGEYDTAYRAFIDLGGFMDSAEMASESLYQKAKTALRNNEYDVAHEIFTNLGNYEDSAEMANESLYQKGKALLEEEKFDQAISVFKEIEDYEKRAEMITEAQYLKACNYLEKKNYRQAVLIFEDISYYKNSADKMKEAMYGYVLAHKNNTDTTTYDYLLTLKSAGYKDSATIYSNLYLYPWKITVLGWSTGKNNTNFMSSLSRNKAVCCHLELSGGSPGGSTRLTYSGIYPNGQSFNGAFEEEWEDGWSGWLIWEDGLSSAGTLKIYFYDENDILIGSSSVKITG